MIDFEQKKPMRQTTERGIPGCEICDGSGYITESRNGAFCTRDCGCVAKKRNIALFERAGYAWNEIKTLGSYETTDPATGKICQTRDRAKKAATFMAKNWNTLRTTKSNCLILCGHKGSGKTHILLAVAKAITQRYGGVSITKHTKMMESLKDFDSGNAALSQTRQKFMESPVLFIDDFLEVERRAGSMTRQDYIGLKTIVDFRYTNNLPVILSSQCLPGLMEELADEIYDRIEERSFETIVFDGPQYNFRPEESRRNAQKVIDLINQKGAK